MNENKKDGVKVYILGSCSGTEPYEGRHHTSVLLELPEGIYWLDAGKCCAYTAHLMGIDLLKTRGIFISHCHMDHIGGLGNLLWNIRKLTVVKRQLPVAETIPVYVPWLESYQAQMELLRHTEDDFACSYGHAGYPVQDGLLYQGGENEGGIAVEAIHNHHLKHEPETPWRSFSFRIRLCGKTIFYSGDTQREDLEYTVPEQCDLLMIETGHHQISEICDCLKRFGKRPKKLLFIHHGVKILKNPQWAIGEVERCWGPSGMVAQDRMTVIV